MADIVEVGMAQNWPIALDRLVPLPVAGLKDFVVGTALHTTRRRVKMLRVLG